MSGGDRAAVGRRRPRGDGRGRGGGVGRAAAQSADDPVVEQSRGLGHPAVVGDERPHLIAELPGCREVNGVERAGSARSCRVVETLGLGVGAGRATRSRTVGRVRAGRGSPGAAEAVAAGGIR